jgi:hypothetical protein
LAARHAFVLTFTHPLYSPRGSTLRNNALETVVFGCFE